jgi:hypothetical protein
MGDQGNPDDDWPEDGGESTIAMEAPPFDASVPLPISNLPPPMEGAGQLAPTPVQVPGTAPVPFTPVNLGGPASTPQFGRQKAPSSPMVPTPLGGITPGGAPSPKAPPVQAAPVPGSAAARALRATRIGVAPPPSAAGMSAKAPTGGGEALFGLDASAADAARAAVAAPARPAPASNRSGFEPPRPPPPSNRGQAAAPPPLFGTSAPVGIPKVENEVDEEEDIATKAAPREAYFRPNQDAHVVIGSGAVGDDATLAVAPEDNEARSQRMAPFAQTMMANDAGDGYGAVPAPSSSFHAPAFDPEPAAAAGMPMPMHGGAPQQAWQDPHAQQWNPPPSNPYPQMGGGPGMMGGPPMMGMQQPMQPGGHYPDQYQGQGQYQDPNQYPGGAEPPFVQLGGLQLTKQHVLVAVVGIVCLAIFITGVVLFATTKF